MAGPSKIEGFKKTSAGLRGDIAGELEGPSAHLGEASRQLLKFHGVYEQDDRDLRAERRRQRRDKSYSFMVRSKIPAGVLTAEQYLAHDDLATRYGNDTLRITTRQDLQLHGVIKGDVKPTLRAINRALVTTLGACGDVVRNVMFCPVPSDDPIRRKVASVARTISDRLLPTTPAYHEIWLDGEKTHDGSVEAPTADPIYGKTYLPRKFKIGVAYPMDNCVDVYTQDVGLVPVVDRGLLPGYNVLVGGGLGMTHKKPETFPRLADPMAFVSPARVADVVTAIVCVQRDHGDRTDRRHARLKYLIHDRGLDWFRAEVERRLGYALRAPVSAPGLEPNLHLGWQRQNRHAWYLGISVANGRIRDLGASRVKTALRELAIRFGPGIRLTPAQDILLTDLRNDQVAAARALLREHGVADPAALSEVRTHSMACPALPTCGLALAEAERVLPDVIDELEVELERLGLGGEALTVRMTGCPNGCARPYVAELGFVGRSADRYVILVGGRRDGTRLNQVFEDLVPTESLVRTVVPLLELFRDTRRGDESFGDFCHRIGVGSLRARVESRRKVV